MERGELGVHREEDEGRIVPGERIMLPLASDGRNCDGVLGASFYQKPAIIGTGFPIEVISDDEVWTALA